MPRTTILHAVAGALGASTAAWAQSENALTDPGFSGTIAEVTTWRANVEGPGVWYGHNFAVDAGVAKLTLEATNWQGRGLLQAVAMPAAGTFSLGLETSYEDYYTQLHYWHILAAKSDASITLTYQNILYAFSNPKAVSVYKEYSRSGEEGNPWHAFEGEFTVTPEIAEEYDYLVFLFVASMNPGQHAYQDNFVLDLSRLSDSSGGAGLAGSTTSSFEYGSSPFCNDLNGDGRPDLFISGSSPRLLIQTPNQAFNAGSFSFSDVRRQCGLVDLDNDGDLDLWASNSPDWYTAAAFWNNGSASFTRQTASALGFTEPSNNEGLCLADVDRDGWCDIIQCSENGYFAGLYAPPGPGAIAPTITSADSAALGLDGLGAAGNGDYVSSGDVNNDGYTDFFYHYGGGRFFLSQGDGTFAEQTGAIAVTTGENDKFGSAWGDYDNDGDLDLFAARLDAGQPCALFRQNAGGSFSEVASAAGITTTAGHRSGCWGDYDNDGDLDLCVVGANGSAHLLYENQGDGTFDETTLPVTGEGSDAVFADYDNDGDLDLLLSRIGAGPLLLENSTDTDRYLKVRVVGLGDGGTNRAGVGVRVEVYSAGGTLLGRRDVGAMRGFAGQEPLWLHFGGVNPATGYAVKAYFNNGLVSQSVVPGAASTTIGSTTIPQMVTITEGQSQLQVVEWQETDPSQ
ncbi:MAG: VCBS repeat-containing protein [Phycisphaerales bacterium]|nr:VCBS repeat-containing protein [Phycisphaerales bacterium]